MKWIAHCIALLALMAGLTSPAGAAPNQPNILVIMGDDVGMFNISAYHRGLLGGATPNIDRIANEGMLFMDYYGEQSCTAGRAAFITGQSPFRTGLLTVGLPGAKIGLAKDDATIADLLRPLGYATAQFGKNHLGDRDEYLPNNHGFDEFFGNLYHLNAEEEPEDLDYPKDPAFRQKFGPRGVLDCTTDGGCKDTGPLTRKRMETADDEFVGRALQFIDKSVKRNKPFFVWANTTRMHVWTRLSPKWEGKSGYGLYADGMMEHDHDVGLLLKKLDDLKIADNTIVIYTTDNGVHFNQWPDAGITPFRGEKNTNWEGGFRVPMVVRWPGHIKADQISNDMISLQDWLPTLMSAAGMPGIKEKLLAGHQVGDKKFTVHLDGYDFLPYLEGKEKKSPRNEFFYFSDDGKLLGMRDGDWKIVFAEQRAQRFDVWRDPFVDLRAPKIFNLRRDPFERADTDSNSYNVWWDHKVGPIALPAAGKVQQFLMTFQKFPPRQRPASFTIDQIVEKLMNFKNR